MAGVPLILTNKKIDMTSSPITTKPNRKSNKSGKKYDILKEELLPITFPKTAERTGSSVSRKRSGKDKNYNYSFILPALRDIQSQTQSRSFRPQSQAKSKKQTTNQGKSVKFQSLPNLVSPTSEATNRNRRLSRLNSRNASVPDCRKSGKDSTRLFKLKEN